MGSAVSALHPADGSAQVGAMAKTNLVRSAGLDRALVARLEEAAAADPKAGGEQPGCHY